MIEASRPRNKASPVFAVCATLIACPVAKADDVSGNSCKGVLSFLPADTALTSRHVALLDRLSQRAMADKLALTLNISTTVDTPPPLAAARRSSLNAELDRLKARGARVVVTYSADLFFTPDIYVSACPP